MTTKLIQLHQRTKELEALADEIGRLAQDLANGIAVQPDLVNKGQQWYRGTRELLAQNVFSGLKQFEDVFFGWTDLQGKRFKNTLSIQEFIGQDPNPLYSQYDYQNFFVKPFRTARSLLLALEAEIMSRELPIRTQLSFAVSADEFETAEALYEQRENDEVILRVSGVVARVALERHLFTVAEAKSITITSNPPKKKAAVSDVLTSLVRAGVITAVQRSHFDSLFSIANNCAHPKDVVNPSDVERLIREGKTAAASVQ